MGRVSGRRGRREDGVSLETITEMERRGEEVQRVERERDGGGEGGGMMQIRVERTKG